MEIFTSYDTAFRSCMSTAQFAIAHLKTLKKNVSIDTSGCCKIFFLLSGNKRFHINDVSYETHPYELYIISQNDWHYFSSFSESDDHERYVVFIHPYFLKSLSTETTSLEKGFHTNPGQSYRIVLEQDEKNRFSFFFSHFSAPDAYGSDLMNQALFLEMLVTINQMRQKPEQSAENIKSRVPNKKLESLLEHIEEHITEEISVESLASRFYFSPSYLCRFFKNKTGTTIHKYITAQRITLAKKFLADGYPVTEVGYMSGFPDYNAFLRAFIANVGTSPKKYAQSYR